MPRVTLQGQVETKRAGVITVVILASLFIYPVSGGAEMYHIEVEGPLGSFVFECGDPCEYGETKQGKPGGGGITLDQAEGKTRRTGSATQRASSRTYAEDNIICIGDCVQESPAQTITFGPVKYLTEGIEVRVREGKARFVFHEIIESEDGPTTRRRVSEFRIDRPLIELELNDHDVLVQLQTPETAEADP